MTATAQRLDREARRPRPPGGQTPQPCTSCGRGPSTPYEAHHRSGTPGRLHLCRDCRDKPHAAWRLRWVLLRAEDLPTN
jgi:hypothetical protein